MMFRFSKSGLLTVLVLCGVLGLTGCAYQPTETVDQNPAARKFTWFSYLDGKDIRSNCPPNSPLRLRAVYNGVYDEQIRTYDLQPRVGEPGAFDLSVRVIGEADLSEVEVKKIGGLLNPWRGTGEKIVLQQGDVALFDRALEADGIFTRPPVGLELHSDEFYWILSVCKEGAAYFNAVKWPNEKFKKAQFPKLLEGWDMTGIPFNPPRQVLNLDNPLRRSEEFRTDFGVRIGENGLWGILQ